MSGEITVSLSKPVKAHGADVSELTFRRPTVSDTLDLGMPMGISTEGEATVLFRPTVIAKYAVRLASVPMGTIKALELDDWMAVQGVIQGFFGRSEEAPASPESGSPSEPLTSPGSSE